MKHREIQTVNTSAYKFSWQQLFSNPNGKTSLIALLGFISVLVCLTLFSALVIFYFFNVLEASTILLMIDKVTTWFSVSCGLLGVKTVSTSFGNGNRVSISNDPENEKVANSNNCNCENCTKVEN